MYIIRCKFLHEGASSEKERLRKVTDYFKIWKNGE